MIYLFEKEDSISKKNLCLALIKIGLLLILMTVGYCVNLSAQDSDKVYDFDINGLRLNMNLDYVIKRYNINNIKVNKDVFDIINGYEIKKRINREKVMIILSFTGEKRLYRIHYNKLNEKFRYHSKDLYGMLIKKYGVAWNNNIDLDNKKNKKITACWGRSCKKYPRTTPILTAQIHHSSGRLELMLSDNRIFNRDWKLYKQKMSSQITDKDAAPSIKKGEKGGF